MMVLEFHTCQINLEQKIQKSFDLSAKYLGLEPPEIKISRDFDIDRLIGQDVTALTSLFDQNVIDLSLIHI